MGQQIRDVMTRNPKVLDIQSTLSEAARIMRDNDIGFVVVRNERGVCGVVTDRDLVIRGLAEGADPANTKLASVYSDEIVQVSADDPVEKAITLMSDKAIRRIPVIEGSEIVGVVSLGDLAVDRDPNSVLGQISAAPAQQ
ncbi:MAG TPA: CBS domain-containing protein [Haliangium sp.]|nr:CBS domain-containing protein [Haliangium sp.]